MAMQRTVFSPRCWATSSTRRLSLFIGLQRVQDLRQVAVEMHVDDSADDLRDTAGLTLGAIAVDGLNAALAVVAFFVREPCARRPWG